MFLALLAATLPVLSAQTPGYRPPPNFAANGKADQAEGARILREFHQAGIAGEYWLAFELRVMPRKGDERTVGGRLFGSRDAAGPLSLLILPGSGGPGDGRRWLIHSGPAPAAWQWTGGASPVSQVTAGDSFQTLAGTDLTLFDLQMPFLYWPDFVYEGLARVRGRPAHSFVLYPPGEVAAVRPGLTGVRVLIDTQFQALVQAELLGAKGTAEQTITILDLRKVGEQWIVKSIDLRNNLTRDKTRFTVTAAALDLALPAKTFEPGALSADLPTVPPEKIQRF